MQIPAAGRILEVVRGNPEAVRKVADAIVHNDIDAIRALLAARGVALSSSEIRAMLRGGSAGRAPTLERPGFCCITASSPSGAR
jgi:hypothetical protein